MLPDLSAYHHPVSRFIEVVAANLNTYCLSTEQIDSYQQNGYLSGIPILTESPELFTVQIRPLPIGLS